MSINKITPLDTFVSNDAPICYGILKPGDHYEGGIPVIKVKNIIGGVILEDDLLKTTPEIHAQYKRAEVKEGDILLTIRGTTGRVAIVPNSLNGANITQDTARIRVSSNDDSLYIFYALQSFNVQQQITLNTVGQAVKGINIAEVKKLKIYHPILDEQKAIAQILSTWDQAISATEKLLENSQQQKKALMQQLLTGKKRLLDENGVKFSDEWQRIELGLLLDYQQPTPYLVESTAYSDSYETPVLTAGKTFILGYTNESSGIYQDQLPVIIFDDFTTDSKYVNFPFKAKSSAMKILTAKKGVSIKFVFEAMQMLQFTVGGHQRHWISIFSNLVIPLPNKKEQQQIAEVLSLADQEIETLQKKLDCLQQEKKALMQQLLTGKKRVKVAA